LARRARTLLALPAQRLENAVTEVAQKLLKKNWEALKGNQGRDARVREMTYDNAEDYLIRAQEALNWHDKSDGRHRRHATVSRRQDVQTRPQRVRQVEVKARRSDSAPQSASRTLSASTAAAAITTGRLTSATVDRA